MLGLVAEGQSNKLVARERDLRHFTVKSHVANSRGKTGLDPRTEAAQ